MKKKGDRGKKQNSCHLGPGLEKLEVRQKKGIHWNQRSEEVAKKVKEGEIQRQPAEQLMRDRCWAIMDVVQVIVSIQFCQGLPAGP